MAVEFGLLGPLMVRCGGADLPIPSGKQRALLAALLVRANQVVSVDELTDVLWGAELPRSARVTLQNYVVRLRKTLRPAGGSRIGTHPHGYAIIVEAAELDVTRFEALLRSARAAADGGSWEIAAERAGAALALWRGEPLADVDSGALALWEVPRLTELRVQAYEAHIDASLHLGRHTEVIVELQQLVAAHPLREHLHAQLMLALWQCGRQAEALSAYRHARRLVIEELGVEPGAELRELHMQILTDEPVLTERQAAPHQESNIPPAVPHELPPRVSYFTGRMDELGTLDGLLDRVGQKEPGTVVISAIGGMAGVGKTALAVHWAHRVAERFPDGQLYVNLRGYDPRQPIAPGDVLARFLRTMGVPQQSIPAELEERAARYRSLLATRRMLIVLDNAKEADQVRPLLPSGTGCAVVVTSRDALAGLVVRDGAARLELDVLPLHDSVHLLRELIGARVDADLESAAALAGQCSRLPLALRVAAELAITRPAVSLAALVGELADQQRRLDLLDASGDPRTAVRAVLSWSYRHLDADVARMFRLAGLHPGPHLNPFAAAALADATLADGNRLLTELVRAHMTHAAGPSRYGMHDLLRHYARELAFAHDSEEQRRGALTRLFDHYLHTAAAAVDVLFPAERHERPAVPQPGSPTPPLVSPAAARAWLDAELAGLVAAARHMATDGWPGHAAALNAVLFRYLQDGDHYSEAMAVHDSAYRAARHTGDRTAQASALTNLGLVHARQGRYKQAAGYHQRALAASRRAHDRSGEARALASLGIVNFMLGRYPMATGHYQQALALYRQAGDRTGEARTLTNLALAEQRQGDYQQAIACYQQAISLFHGAGDQASQAWPLANLGALSLRQGQYQQARDYCQRAMAMFRDSGNRSGEAYTLTNSGDLSLRQLHYQEAVSQHQHALAIFRQTGDRSGQSQALNGLGEAALATGQPGSARTRHASALGLATQIGDKYEQARAHHGLARSHHAAGRQTDARHHWQRALALYAGLGAPETDQIRAELAADDTRMPDCSPDP